MTGTSEPAVILRGRHKGKRKEELLHGNQANASCLFREPSRQQILLFGALTTPWLVRPERTSMQSLSSWHEAVPRRTKPLVLFARCHSGGGMGTDLQNVETSGFAMGVSTGLDKTRADAPWRVSLLDLSLKEVWNPKE